MPYTTNVAATTITAAWANANVRDQVVTPFASTSARNSAITAPIDGMVCTTTDTDTLWAYNGTAWVAVGGYGAWTSFTPAITQSSGVTATVSRSTYQRSGRMITWTFSLVVTGTGTASNPIRVSIPVTAATSGFVGVGAGLIYDSSATTTYAGTWSLNTTSSIEMFRDGAANVAVGQAGMTAALASGDQITGTIVYEAAS